MTTPATPAIVDRETWLSASRELLEQEKALTRRRDELAAQRRKLPWVLIDKTYTFDTNDGPRTLADLFDGRTQLIVSHFMMGPDWDEGCPSCSFWADHYNGIDIHLAQRNVTFVTVARAPLAAINAYTHRMGWDLTFVSSDNSDFNMDFNVSFPAGYHTNPSYNFELLDPIPMEEFQGLSVFSRTDDGEVFHTYSSYARGMDIFNSAYHLLDITPDGRDEDDLSYGMAWLRRHDEYPATPPDHAPETTEA